MDCICSKCGSKKLIIELENAYTGENIDICEACLDRIFVKKEAKKHEK